MTAPQAYESKTVKLFYSVSQVCCNSSLSGATWLRIAISCPSFWAYLTVIAVPPCHSPLFRLIKLKLFLQIRKEPVYVLTSSPYKENYLTIIPMSLPHLPMSAYNHQDIVLHIQGACLLPKHLGHIQSMVLLSILLPLFRSLFVKHIRQKWLHQYSFCPVHFML